MLGGITRSIKMSTHRGEWWLAAAFGVVLTAGGLFGVSLQGALEPDGPLNELRLAFILPTAVTTSGSLMIAAVLLASPLTSAWTLARRLLALFCFAVLVLITCTVCGYLAVSRYR